MCCTTAVVDSTILSCFLKHGSCLSRRKSRPGQPNAGALTALQACCASTFEIVIFPDARCCLPPLHSILHTNVCVFNFRRLQDPSVSAAQTSSGAGAARGYDDSAPSWLGGGAAGAAAKGGAQPPPPPPPPPGIGGAPQQAAAPTAAELERQA